MKTLHRLILQDAASMSELQDGAAQLAVTSPPYPMIAMWDAHFSDASPEVAAALDREDGPAAFAAMHAVLDPVWRETVRALAPGGIACVNIGDAVRTIGGRFSLYPNHARILSRFMELGMSPLPAILWRKQTNAPNKFMGSGMLSPGAYVTLEHEFILIFRKGEKREFPGQEAESRRESAYFWEERNTWFSDVWTDLKGRTQGTQGRAARKRSAAFPFELAYRLIAMFSIAGDTVIDPFCGTGTTLSAAMALGRNSVGFEVDASIAAEFREFALGTPAVAEDRLCKRLEDHLAFVADRIEKTGKPLKHFNEPCGFPVVTRQETALRLHRPTRVTETGPLCFEAEHEASVPPPSQQGLFP